MLIVVQTHVLGQARLDHTYINGDHDPELRVGEWCRVVTKRTEAKTKLLSFKVSSTTKHAVLGEFPV